MYTFQIKVTSASKLENTGKTQSGARNVICKHNTETHTERCCRSSQWMGRGIRTKEAENGESGTLCFSALSTQSKSNKNQSQLPTA